MTMRTINKRLDEVAFRAAEIRYLAMESIVTAGTGHPGPSLSVADIIAVLYFSVLRLDPKKPGWPERDRVVLSKGHACPALYAALAILGYFPVEELRTFRRVGSRLQGHPDLKSLPGVDATTGSLGNGLSIALGMALAARVAGLEFQTFAVLGDGELQEGLVWEAAMAAGAYQAANLTAVIDYNGLQSSGRVREIMKIEPLVDKWVSFSWEAREIDGHNLQELQDALTAVRQAPAKPTVIIAHTIKGKGVSFMEGKYEWHARKVEGDEASQALTELRAAYDLASRLRGDGNA